MRGPGLQTGGPRTNFNSIMSTSEPLKTKLALGAYETFRASEITRVAASASWLSAFGVLLPGLTKPVSLHIFAVGL